MERRTFLARLGQTLVALPIATMKLACDPAEPEAITESFTTESSIDSDHSHVLILTCGGLKGGMTSYFTSDANGHTHVVRLTFAEVTSILNNESVIVQTESGGHIHTFTLQKPGNLCD